MRKRVGANRLPIAVIDNTLLTRLKKVGLAEKLPFIFKQIRIPPEVRSEAYRGRNKRELKNLLDGSGNFFVKCLECDIANKEILKTVPKLHEGEAAAIAQAEATHSVLISDDQVCFYQATARNLEVFRTGRILCLLKEAGQLGKTQLDNNVAPYLQRLLKLGFYLSKAAVKEILTEASEIDSLDKFDQLETD